MQLITLPTEQHNIKLNLTNKTNACKKLPLVTSQPMKYTLQ